MESSTKRIKAACHFRDTDDGAVLLNREGKRVFLEKLEGKLDGVFRRGGGRITYRRLLAEEIAAYQRFIVAGEEYKPFKKY